MITGLLASLLLPFAAPPLARWAAPRLRPPVALWALTVTACALAAGWLAALGGLLLTGALGVSALARLGHLIHPLDVAPPALADPAAALAVGALSLCAYGITRSVLRQLRHYRRAREQVRGAAEAGDLSILDRPDPDAYALPGNPGRVVVTSGMLRALDGPEREALLAHERAHLSGRHHWFLAAADLAARCHPALRAVRDAIALAAERVADEAAAAATGDRRLTARAIGRAALAGQGHGHGRGGAAVGARPAFAARAVGGPVPQRVRALLHPPAARPLAAAAAACLLMALAAGTTVTTGVGLDLLHRDVEVAQGEAPGGH
ncbi:M48 family metalloprotease [Streptomyces sp. NPDC046557]|uniref:M48 family metalloprotease n=1 Tax=Streptomyces sp. NPDC046557 TaxID=3155372 RepID=UPI0033E4D33F